MIDNTPNLLTLLDDARASAAGLRHLLTCMREAPVREIDGLLREALALLREVDGYVHEAEALEAHRQRRATAQADDEAGRLIT